MIDLETRIEILLCYFAAAKARLQEIENKIEKVEKWNS